MILVDAHCDSLEKASQTQSSLISPYNFSKNHRQLQFAAIFCGVEGESPKDSYLRAHRLLGQYTLSLSSEGLLPVRNSLELDEFLRSDRNGLLLSMEGSTGLLGDPAILEKFYNAGLRVMGLCWTHNELAKSSRLLEGEKDTGLSAQGRKMVEAGNRLGMLFDVSHLSDRSFWDLSALSKKPILATHSDFRALCSCNRNLTDEMAQKIVRQDGMIGLNLCPKFLSDREERQTLFGFFDHLEYGLAHFGEDHLGFGLDIDGIDRYPEPLTPDSSLHDRIAEFLLKHYPQRVVEKISGSNFISFLKKYL